MELMNKVGLFAIVGLLVFGCACPDIDSVAVNVTVVDSLTGKHLCGANVVFGDEVLLPTNFKGGRCSFNGGYGTGKQALSVSADGYDKKELFVTVEERCGGEENTALVTVSLTPRP